jgi:hypothetical protein
VLLPLNDSDFTKLLELKNESRDVDIEAYLDNLLFEIKAESPGT